MLMRKTMEIGPTDTGNRGESGRPKGTADVRCTLDCGNSKTGLGR